MKQTPSHKVLDLEEVSRFDNLLVLQMFWGKPNQLVLFESLRFCSIGAGDFYSSGNDLNNMMQIDPSRMHEASKEGGVLLG